MGCEPRFTVNQTPITHASGFACGPEGTNWEDVDGQGEREVG